MISHSQDFGASFVYVAPALALVYLPNNSNRTEQLTMLVALGVELYTGNSVFKGIGIQKLQAASTMCAVSTLSAGGFAFAWRAKSDAVGSMARDSKKFVESAIYNLIDYHFFDEA